MSAINTNSVSLAGEFAVNLNGNFGTWEFKTLEDPKDVFDVVK